MLHDDTDSFDPFSPRSQSTYIPKPDCRLDELYACSAISSGINFEKYDDIQCKVTGPDIPEPIDTFESANLDSRLVDSVIRRSSFVRPTPVQRYSLPIISGGRDMMGCAQTGSGKTMAYLLPIVNFLLKRSESQKSVCQRQSIVAPLLLVLAPTRELAIQIKDETRKVCDGTPFTARVVYGGTSVKAQSDLMSGLDQSDLAVGKTTNILIATPDDSVNSFKRYYRDRLNQFVRDGRVQLHQIIFLVIDEADRMLDMNFVPDIRWLVDHHDMPTTSTRVTVMFSATLGDRVQALARDFLDKDYIFLAVGIVGGACSDVTQTVVQVDLADKNDQLVSLLKTAEGIGEARRRVLVFVEKKITADFVADMLNQIGLQAASIHGDRDQGQREEAVENFKTGVRPILVATSVFARGMNVRGISHVVNYDLPNHIDDYVHRIGRTGRIGNPGRATSFFDMNRDVSLAPTLIKILSEAQQRVPDWLASLCRLVERPYLGSQHQRYGNSEFNIGSSSAVESAAVAERRPVETEGQSAPRTTSIRDMFGGMDLRERESSLRTSNARRRYNDEFWD